MATEELPLSRTSLPGVSDAPVTRVAVSGASSGDNTLVAAAGAGKGIRVLAICVKAASAVTFRLESGAGGTALTGVVSLVANGDLGWSLPFNPAGWCDTAANALLNMELGGAVQVSGVLVYQTVSIV
jgi:hypothetical protein